MQQALKTKHELRLYELKKAANEFIEFTENFSLLQTINIKAQEAVQAVNTLQQLLEQRLSDDELVKAINSSVALIFFDEIVDADAMSNLEGYILSAAENIEDAEISIFLTDMMDRVELKYNRLLEKVHAYNALLIG